MVACRLLAPAHGALLAHSLQPPMAALADAMEVVAAGQGAVAVEVDTNL
jgi:hypothetical protein